jgi:hypothetical protein
MPVSSHPASETDLVGMEIAGLGLAMIALSVVLLLWAFPRVPHR